MFSRKMFSIYLSSRLFIFNINYIDIFFKIIMEIFSLVNLKTVQFCNDENHTDILNFHLSNIITRVKKHCRNIANMVVKITEFFR